MAVTDEYEEYDATFFLVLALFIVQLLLAVMFAVFLTRRLNAIRVKVCESVVVSIDVSQLDGKAGAGDAYRPMSRPSMFFGEDVCDDYVNEH